MTVIQVIVSAASIFVAYSFLLLTTGVEQLGILSLVVSVVAVIRIGEIGLSGSVVKFIASSLAKKELADAVTILGTCFISVAVILASALALGYPILVIVINNLVPEQPVAMQLLPFVMGWLWLSAISSIFQSALDGCNRGDQRGITNIVGSLIYVGTIILTVPLWGLIAVAYAQLIQAAAILALSWWLLRRHLPRLPIIRWQWNKKTFLSIVRYGLNYQIISVASALLDPFTKVFLTKFGGLSATGYFEMANRMIMQFRAIPVLANQVLVPIFAGLDETRGKGLSDAYLSNLRAVIYISVPYYAAIAAAIPLISLLWLGHFETSFVTFSLLLLAAWFNNNIAAPAYFAGLGTGQLGWNVIGQVAITTLNIVLGFSLGIVLGAVGVVIGYCIGLVVGSWIIVLGFQERYEIPMRKLLGEKEIPLVIMALAGVAISWIIGSYGNSEGTRGAASAAMGLIAYALVVMLPIWRHPLRGTILEWLKFNKRE